MNKLIMFLNFSYLTVSGLKIYASLLTSRFAHPCALATPIHPVGRPGFVAGVHPGAYIGKNAALF